MSSLDTRDNVEQGRLSLLEGEGVQKRRTPRVLDTTVGRVKGCDNQDDIARSHGE